MQKLTQTLLVATALCVPALCSATTIETIDTVAGISTEIAIADLTPKSEISLTLISPIGEHIAHTLTATNNGEAHTWIAGNDLQVAGKYEVRVDGVKTGGLTVHPDTIDPVASFIDTQKQEVAIGEEITVTVVVTDRFGNALAGRSMELISSRSEDLITALTRETDVYGEQKFIVRSAIGGAFSLRAIDLVSSKTLTSTANILAGHTYDGIGGPQFYRGNPYSANTLQRSRNFRAQAVQQEAPRFDRIDIQIVGQENATLPTVEQYNAESMILTAVDQYGDRFFDYIGPAYMATTDPEAVLPAFGSYDFRFEDEGQKILTLGLKFATAGLQQMILTEDPDIIPEDPTQALGFLEINVETQQVNRGNDQNMFIASPVEADTLNDTVVVVEGTGPAFINITVTGGLREVSGETDRNGNFSVPVELDTTQTNHTITVQDSEAPQNNADVNFTLDIKAPDIMSFTFTPENPIEETDVLVVVQTEPNLSSIALEIDGQSYDLTSTDPSSGKYQMLLSAPLGGTYDATVRATDSLGNEGTETKSISVSFRGLPIVQNVIADSQISAIGLEWEPLENVDVDAYRIYVGSEPNEFLYTLDTDRPTAAATVAGLLPGNTYYFAVTALDGQRESEQKSQTISATVLGVKLNTTPQDGALFVEWNSLSKDIPIADFLLEYGTEPGQFVEKRNLNGDLRAFTLRDLINGVEYYLKLTPISTTGELLDELAADGQGTPIGAGFTAGISDPAPFDLRPGAPPEPVTQIPLSEQGLPSWAFWAVLAGSIGVYRMVLQKRKQQAATQAFFETMQSRYHR